MLSVTRDELRRQCRAMGVKVHGSKAELLHRLKALGKLGDVGPGGTGGPRDWKCPEGQQPQKPETPLQTTLKRKMEGLDQAPKHKRPESSLGALCNAPSDSFPSSGDENIEGLRKFVVEGHRKRVAPQRYQPATAQSDLEDDVTEAESSSDGRSDREIEQDVDNVILVRGDLQDFLVDSDTDPEVVDCTK